MEKKNPKPGLSLEIHHKTKVFSSDSTIKQQLELVLF